MVVSWVAHANYPGWLKNNRHSTCSACKIIGGTLLKCTDCGVEGCEDHCGSHDPQFIDRLTNGCHCRRTPANSAQLDEAHAQWIRSQHAVAGSSHGRVTSASAATDSQTVNTLRRSSRLRNDPPSNTTPSGPPSAYGTWQIGPQPARGPIVPTATTPFSARPVPDYVTQNSPTGSMASSATPFSTSVPITPSDMRPDSDSMVEDNFEATSRPKNEHVNAEGHQDRGIRGISTQNAVTVPSNTNAGRSLHTAAAIVQKLNVNVGGDGTNTGSSAAGPRDPMAIKELLNNEQRSAANQITPSAAMNNRTANRSSARNDTPAPFPELKATGVPDSQPATSASAEDGLQDRQVVRKDKRVTAESVPIGDDKERSSARPSEASSDVAASNAASILLGLAATTAQDTASERVLRMAQQASADASQSQQTSFATAIGDTEEDDELNERPAKRVRR
ncbi:Eukaryotic peptide chain release factor GTP-binding subunit [Sphaceloma murrayae]|uniref:Eukaryotic peptide chain release factor GTP-binding subunit n=1 Tax=Sphaceloma murrayae TaxID=2082308 RepID=A0A2K1QH06_9PEZI|nr:Eukaryotic peptide chain release factor GTP-binding subunit [Sphaceloma murrayae]